MLSVKNKFAFTLIEVLIVVVIISTLAALALPRFLVVIERVKSSEGVQILTTLLAAQKRYFLENNAYKDGTGGGNSLASGDLDVNIPASSNFGLIQIYNNATILAQVLRTTSNTYNLKIDSNGNVACHNVLAGSGLCSRMGFTTTY